MITGQTVSNTYQGDGSTRDWTISFEFTDSSQVKFKVNGEEVTNNYSLNTVSKVLTYPTVASELDALKSTDEIEIYRDTEITQDIEFLNGGQLNAEMIESGLDKLTMIAQEVKNLVAGTEDDEEVEVLTSGTNIDEVTEAGIYFVVSPTSSSDLPPVIVNEYGSYEPYTRAVLLVVKNIDRDSTYFNGQQIGYFVGIGENSDAGYPYAMATRTLGERSWGWQEISRISRQVGALNGQNLTPTYFWGKTSYFIPSKSSLTGQTSLYLNSIEDTPLPIEIYFRTGETFSGITAPDIIGWIGSTTLDTNSVYKITITNLIGKIEKVTLVE